MTSISTNSLGRPLGKVFAVALAGLLGVSAAAVSSAASSGGPFDGLEGSWGGNGTVTYASGTKERLRCRVQYTQANPDNLQQALRCASDSYKFQINAFFQHSGGNLSGRWDEKVLNIKGTLTGTATSGHIVGQLHGPGFLASVRVDTTGDRQSVTISSADQDIRLVNIAVSRGGK
jgi:hypothetical protein